MRVFALSLVILILFGCGRRGLDYFPGYLEGEFLFISAQFTGKLEKLPVDRGQNVKDGDLLFSLEKTEELEQQKQSEARLKQVGSQLEDLKKSLRPEEIKAFEAQVARAEAACELSAVILERNTTLVKAEAIAKSAYDLAFYTHKMNLKSLDEARQNLATAKLASRTDAIAAAEAQTNAITAELKAAEWRTSQKDRHAPEDAFVFDTLYNEGEIVEANRPVVVLLPPGNVKARFFVPEKVVNTLKVGQAVRISFTGMKNPVEGRINFISSNAEYTPPVIYSKDYREKLVFMIEAGIKPELAKSLHPGQPVDVKIIK
ncbi:MAG: HlyD family efflux transporter periplasmic adaptor subunit [Victivallales bacterium]|jgi:HlyD family secretion protein